MSCLQRSVVTLAVLLATGVPAFAQDQADVSAAIRSVLATQGKAWNRGDLQGYLASLSRDQKTRHVFNDEITVGYVAIKERFQSRYPDPSNMGTISFSDLEVTVLAPDAAAAFAHWTFEQTDRAFSGVFTLILRRVDEQWVIVHDHSTAFSNE